MPYPTRRAVLLVLVGIPLALGAALFAPKFWIAGVVWILFTGSLCLLDALLAGAPVRGSIENSLPMQIGVGRAQDARFAVAFAGAAPGKVEFALDTGLRLAVVPPRLVAPVFARTARASFALEPLRRGEGRLERLWLRWHGPLGLAWRQKSEPIGRDVPIVPNIESVKDQAVKLFQREQGIYGVRVQLRTGEGNEFHALRNFRAGMERRTIDWKQSARHRRLLAREFQAEENLHLVLALDTGRLMCEPLAGQPRIDRALQAMLLMAYVGLKGGDRIGFFAFDERVRVDSGTVSGAAAFPFLHRLAATIDYTTCETNFTLGLSGLAASLEHRSIVVVFTEFADTTSAELMIENLGRLLARHLVFFVAFRDEELESMIDREPLSSMDVSRAAVADAVLRERELVLTRLKRMGVEVIDAPVEKIAERLLESYLMAKRRGRL